MNLRFLTLLVVLAIVSALPLRLLAQYDHQHAKQHMEAHGKAALQRALALSKNAKSTLASAKNYDVTFYDLNTVILKNELEFSGRVEMRFVSLIDGLDEVQFNFGSGGVVDSVFVDGVPVPFSHTTEIVTVTLPAALDSGSASSITTTYKHSLAGSAILRKTLNNISKAEQTISLASQSEPYDARNWWPCKDDPDDKADSANITITTDVDMIPVSNGRMIADQDNMDGTHTVLWHSRYPIVTYLVSVAISGYNFNQYSWDYDGKSMPVGSWYVSMTPEYAVSQDNVMLNALTIFSNLFGAYPFMNEKYGMAEYTWGGAMEHQTVSSMGAYFPDIVTHELTHQWFGDKVTCGTFGHIWLNEGWATYGEALYYEFGGNKALAAQLMRDAAYFGPGTIYVNDPENAPFGVIFSGNLTYNKASWVVHMLRGVVGDSAFFRATRKYLGGDNLSTYRSVRTEEFQQFYEDESGLDLDFFFNQWIYGEYYPTYLYGWDTQVVAGKFKTTVRIEQRYVPQRQVFTMPIQITFMFTDHDTTITIWNDAQFASYDFEFDEMPLNIGLDRDNWILKRIQLEPQPLVNNDFPKSILLVNGIDWDVSAYTTQVKNAYRDSSFTGTRPYTFYDLFPYPSSGYPPNIQEVNGSTEIPLEELQKFCTVVWNGNAYNDDDIIWNSTPILEYVQRGGNVILITRQGQDFIDEDMRQHLGITWTRDGLSFVRQCDAKKIGLMNMPLFDDNNRCATFSTQLLSPYSELIFTDDSTFAQPEGIGVWAKPQPTVYGQSGHFVFISLRGYRIDRTLLEQNMSFMLDSMICAEQVNVEPIQKPDGISLGQSYPNPVSGENPAHVRIDFTLAGSSPEFVTLRIYNQLGQLMAEPLNGAVPPGQRQVVLDTRGYPPGLYIYRLTAQGTAVSKTFTVTR